MYLHPSKTNIWEFFLSKKQQQTGHKKAISGTSLVVCNLASINKKTGRDRKEKKEITVYFSPRSIVWVFNVFAQIQCVCVSVWFRVDCVQLIYLKAFFFFFSKFFFRVRRCRCGGVFFLPRCMYSVHARDKKICTQTIVFPPSSFLHTSGLLHCA